MFVPEEFGKSFVRILLLPTIHLTLKSGFQLKRKVESINWNSVDSNQTIIWVHGSAADEPQTKKQIFLLKISNDIVLCFSFRKINCQHKSGLKCIHQPVSQLMY